MSKLLFFATFYLSVLLPLISHGQERITYKLPITAQESVTAPDITVTISDGDVAASELDKSNTVIITTDSDAVVSKVADSPTLKGKTILVPFGRLVKNFNDSKVAEVLKSTSKSIALNIKRDPIAFILVTYNTGMDSVAWLHATNLSTLQQTGNVFFTIVTALYFGLDKDRWAKTTAPISEKIKSYFAKSKNWHRNGFQEIATKFTASLILSSSIALARIPMISPDSFLEVGLHFSQLTMPLMMSFLSTFASFAWNEEIARIDERVYPHTKSAARFILTVRSAILGTWATTAALLNPAVYGIEPWVVLSAVGTGGLLFYLNFHKYYEVVNNKIDTLKESILNKFTMPANPISCEFVFR